MVYQLAADSREKTFVISPNQSMSWRELQVAFAVIAVVTLGIAGFFAWHGLTLVLPFAGLELLALGIALYVTAWRGGIREVITIDDDYIIYESGRKEPDNRYSMQRQWARVVLKKPWAAWHPSRLFIRSHGKEIEIGRFLNEEERQGLAQVLTRAI